MANEIIVSHFTCADLMIGVSWYDPDDSEHPCLQAVIVRGSTSELRKYKERETRGIMSGSERLAAMNDDRDNVRKYYAETINNHYMSKGAVQ